MESVFWNASSRDTRSSALELSQGRVGYILETYRSSERTKSVNRSRVLDTGGQGRLRARRGRRPNPVHAGHLVGVTQAPLRATARQRALHPPHRESTFAARIATRDRKREASPSLSRNRQARRARARGNASEREKSSGDVSLATDVSEENTKEKHTRRTSARARERERAAAGGGLCASFSRAFACGSRPKVRRERERRILFFLRRVGRRRLPNSRGATRSSPGGTLCWHGWP